MPRFTVIVQEVAPRIDEHDEEIVERLKVTIDTAGPLDHAAILAAVGKTKRIYGPRKPKVEA